MDFSAIAQRMIETENIMARLRPRGVHPQVL